MLRRSFAGSAAAAFVVVLSVSSASFGAEPKDAQAEKTLSEIEDDFLETKFDQAETKLRASIEACGQTLCTPVLKAKLYASLGSILAAGKKQLEDAKEAFVEALKIDKTITPPKDMASGEVTFAFEGAKKELKIGSDKPVDKPADKPVDKPKVDKPVEPKDKGKPKVECDATTPCVGALSCVSNRCVDSAPETPPAAPSKKYWVTVAFMPDVAVFSGQNVCTKAVQDDQRYVCIRQNQTRYVGTPTQDNADNINTGFALGTLRVVLGVERLLAENASLGARVGFAFNGATQGGASFIPVHLELRGTLYPGKRPFEGAGVRPYFFLSGGLSEVDASVDVQVLEDGKTCGADRPNDTNSQCSKPSSDGVTEKRLQTLKAYKQGGPGFVGGGFGFQIAPVANAAFIVGVRGSVLFPSVIGAITPEAGFALGF
jgi:hypothetical protein